MHNTLHYTHTYEHAILHQMDLQNSLKNYNYIVHCRQTGHTAAIDPTYAEPVLEALQQQGWTLDTILTTHHHHDHIGGNHALKEATGCRIIAHGKDAHRIQPIDVQVYEEDVVMIGNLEAHVIDVSGHTINHIAYHIPKAQLLFSGDTVFSMGCGRLFEGTAEQMLSSFHKIMALPDDTLICAAHEYTRANGRFAMTIDPDNTALRARMKDAGIIRKQGLPTVPVTLGLEKQTNPFMRVEQNHFRTFFHMPSANDAAIFATIRQKKDLC